MDDARLTELWAWASSPSGPASIGPMTLLAFARAGGLAWLAPGWSGIALTTRSRFVLAAFLALVVAPGAAHAAPVTAFPAPRDVAGWSILLFGEVVIGAFLGIGASLIVAGARQAGELIGLQSGLAPSTLFGMEPSGGLVGEGAGEEATPLAALYGWIALLVFFALNGPLQLVDALVHSYTILPPALRAAGQSAWLSTTLAHDAFERLGAALHLAVQAGAPAAITLILSSLAIALHSRASSGSPFSGLAWPLRLVVGIAASAVFAWVVASAAQSAWQAWASAP